MLRDHRPYRVKKAYLKLQEFYTEHFLRPQFTCLGKGHTFIRPWNVELFGAPIEIGDYVNMIASRDRQVRLAPVTQDSYGRTVAVMYTLPDGLDVNREMIRQGNAWVYRRYTRDTDLIALETAAREARLGLWALPEAERVPPWQWRSQNRRGGRSENGD